MSASVTDLGRLLNHAESLGNVAQAVRATVEEVEARLRRNDICVVVVGERQSGKTTFLDAIVGDRSLSGALGHNRVVTVLQRRASPSFRAIYRTGGVEDFARRVPDRTQALTQELAAAKQPLAEVEAAVVASRAEVEARSDAVSAHAVETKLAFDEFESARNAAQRIGTEIEAIERDVTASSTALATTQRGVPRALVEPTPWWLVWLWLPVLFFVLFRRALWQRYAAERQAKDELVASRSQRQREASDAAEACMRAEGKLARLGPALDERRSAAAAAKSALASIERRHAELVAEVERLSAELAEHATTRQHRFFVDLAAVVADRTPGKDMVELTIDYPARLLPDDISIIDAPGVMSDDAAEQSRTWSLIRQRADGCILLSEIERGVSAPAKRFLQQAREVVPHVLLVLTKVDLAFELAVQRGGGDPWEQVEQARRIGTRRFAREIGRDADAVLSIAVAAEAALEHGGLGTSLARRFEMEVDKLFQLLRHERALILGARSASALRGCIAGIAEAEAAVEHAYQARIAKLEADRIPEPDAFKQQQLDAVAPSVRDAAERAVGDASRGVDDGFKLIQAAIVERMSHVRTPREVLEEAGAIETDVNAGVAGVRLEANLGLESAIDVAVRDIEGGLFARLRTRYDLIHEVRREVVSSPRLDGLSESQTAIVPSSDRVTRAVVSFKRQRVGFGLGGAATGALIGSAVLPGLGTLAGALVGALLVFTRTTSALRKRVIANLFDSLTGERQAIVDELVARTDGVAEAIRAALDRSLDRVIRRFERFISEPIEAERRAIENERAKLRDIEALAGELERHDRRLAELMKAAADESLGLCR